MTSSQPRRCLVALTRLVLLLTASSSLAASISYPAHVAVYFSPSGGCTEVVVHALAAAQQQVFVQAYSFTSAPIAKALTDARKRGVKVMAVVDKSNQTAKYSAATFLLNAGIPTLIDDQHAIAHNKVMVIDSATILTGSFNFTKAAEEQNAENLLVITDAPELAKEYEANILAHAAHSHPYQRTTAGGAQGGESSEAVASQESQKSGGVGAIKGNPKSKIYHLPTCPGYDRLNPATVVTFTSEVEARRAGYRKAKNCP
jgi:phosphatidylserine/phosphatidylglycerophosphate/cardiolipin synthase-like enzyme